MAACPRLDTCAARRPCSLCSILCKLCAFFTRVGQNAASIRRIFEPACTYIVVRCTDVSRLKDVCEDPPLSLPSPAGGEGFLIPLPSRDGPEDGDLDANPNALLYGPADFTG